MKKLLSLVLVLMVILPCAAMAESPEVELTTYTHANQLYTIGYPADWTVLDKASIESISNAVAEGQIDGLSNEQVQAYAQQITSADMTIFTDPAGNHVNVVVQELGTDMSADMLVSMVAPSIVSQYESMFEGCTVTDTGSVATINGRGYMTLAVTYEVVGIELSLSQYMIVVNGTLYTVTFTSLPDDADMDARCEAMMNSLVLAE